MEKMENNATVNQEQNEGFVRETPNEESVVVKEVKFKIFGKEIKRYYTPEQADRIEKRIAFAKKAGGCIGVVAGVASAAVIFNEGKKRGIASMDNLIDTKDEQINLLTDRLNEKADRISVLNDRIYALENPEETVEEETPLEGVNVVYNDGETVVDTF